MSGVNYQLIGLAFVYICNAFLKFLQNPWHFKLKNRFRARYV